MGKWDFLSPYDAQVQSALAAGDMKQAFVELLEGYQAIVVQYCTTVLANAADGEDVAQEVFVGIWRALPRYQPTAQLRTWIFRIARNQCRKHQVKGWYRRRQGAERQRIADGAMLGPLPSLEDQQQAQVDAEGEQHQLSRLECSLRQLPKRERTLLLMYYYEELSFRAMAQRLWRSEATVRRAVHAAEQRLRTRLTGAESPCGRRRLPCGELCAQRSHGFGPG